MSRTGPSFYRRVERRVVSWAMGIVVFFLERVVVRSARKTKSA